MNANCGNKCAGFDAESYLVKSYKNILNTKICFESSLIKGKFRNFITIFGLNVIVVIIKYLSKIWNIDIND